MHIAGRVEAALARGDAVVALESTVITHGLPHPRNVEVASALEDVVRAEGAEPATIGIVAGRPIVGLEARDLERLGGGPDAAKASLRDLGALVARGSDAGTTVAATAWLAARAGIPVFATGGIGGVHPGGSLDVSADLTTLARAPVAVVCAGAKAILDLPRTLEALETLGVPVLGLGTRELPAFYHASSGLEVPHVVPDPASAARAIAEHRALDPATGVLLCVPPPEEAALPAAEVEGWIERARGEAEAAGIGGKTLTPWLLDRLAELSDGRTITANAALLQRNARVAARVAVALSALRGGSGPADPEEAARRS
ncbi:MAG: pseudouridine-5'-phosphate glycosidase [Gemmatimonadota bacterium]|nr:pseudouridine-5'-phosphate glycosidase [Gemmatimonadota bacterium]